MYKLLSLTILGALLGGCVTQTVDQMVFNEPTAGIGDSTVVILGRRDGSDQDTETGFCSTVSPGTLPGVTNPLWCWANQTLSMPCTPGLNPVRHHCSPPA